MLATRRAGAVALPPEIDEIVQRSADRMRADWDANIARLLVDWDPITQVQSQELQSQVRQMVENNDIAGLEDLEVTTADAHALLRMYLLAMFETGEDQIHLEQVEQGIVNLRPMWEVVNSLTADVIEILGQVAQVIVSGLASGLCKAVAGLVLRRWGAQVDPDSMATEVREFIDGLSDRALRDELGGGLTQAMNRGRFAAQLRSNAATWYATERNDPSRCQPCETIDETQFATLAAAMAAYPTGGYVDCRGGVRCRGGVVPVWVAS